MSAALPTADLCDAFPDRVRVIEPLLRDWGGVRSFAGPVETLRVHDDNALVRKELETPGKGRVLVVDGGGSLRTALLGGRLAALAHENGWSGVVIYGCVRDTAELAATPVGVKALQAQPRKSAKVGTGDRGIPVTFGGVTLAPGDWVYADADGVVVTDSELRL